MHIKLYSKVKKKERKEGRKEDWALQVSIICVSVVQCQIWKWDHKRYIRCVQRVPTDARVEDLWKNTEQMANDNLHPKNIFCYRVHRYTDYLQTSFN
jgi:hypothetical protein